MLASTDSDHFTVQAANNNNNNFNSRSMFVDYPNDSNAAAVAAQMIANNNSY